MTDHDAEGTDCSGKGISDLFRHSNKGSRLGCWPYKRIHRNSQMHPELQHSRRISRTVRWVCLLF